MTSLTHSTKPAKLNEIKRIWHLVDLKDKILGRTTPGIAKLLQGKHKPSYVPYLDVGDYVVAINAKYVVISGRKAQTKVYTRYSGYPGGLKVIPYEEMMKRNPTEIIKRAVSGMLPKNKLRDRRLSRLYIFKDENHPYIGKFQLTNSKDKVK
ncbi:MAG: hypothetical protein US11_C0001G0126 [Candidatus Roizmanbacteria bacterium GW2011_GWA2_36_23]|uniref:Large ribosomal subunit protein uL13 n=1 Tax=Candidatus Roizmanbacteria bacterium GW2011_GWA2_36_23 TaxID=1618480 RepID=A0A0G0E9J6_9BACT|nr:MAG: hypothetical protein US11_C0001G0126 [Candidatus Roizmanbacteria bacterium GW2011_GWA2_36_23]